MSSVGYMYIIIFIGNMSNFQRTDTLCTDLVNFLQYFQVEVGVDEKSCPQRGSVSCYKHMNRRQKAM